MRTCLLLCLLAVAAMATTRRTHFCSFSVKAGPCEAAIPRWYYSAAQRTCLPFSWGGCQANGNNFRTAEECNIHCCGGRCGRPAVTVKPQKNRCREPLKVGPCEAAISRWYYSAAQRTCLPFSWGGCQANGNNFRTAEECNIHCCGGRCGRPTVTVRPQKNRCREPLKVGPCEAAISRWYYSAAQRTCLPFSWGGCRPNGNNFRSLVECNGRCCRGRCGRPKFCYLPAVVGPCDADIPSYYFDGRRCNKFTYGGCGGNKNRFSHLRHCRRICKTHH